MSCTSPASVSEEKSSWSEGLRGYSTGHPAVVGLRFAFYDAEGETVRTHSCSGVVYSDHDILTAAHCLIPRYEDGSLLYYDSFHVEVLGGADASFPATTSFKVRGDDRLKERHCSRTSYYVDPAFPAPGHDVGILRSLAPLGLPKAPLSYGFSSDANLVGEIVAYGPTSSDLSTMARRTAPAVFNSAPENAEIAAKPAGGTTTCKGDSGGAVMRNGQLVGIVSHFDTSGMYSTEACQWNTVTFAERIDASITVPSDFSTCIEPDESIVGLEIGVFADRRECTGVVVGPNAILTAAHCVKGALAEAERQSVDTFGVNIRTIAGNIVSDLVIKTSANASTPACEDSYYIHHAFKGEVYEDLKGQLQVTPDAPEHDLAILWSRYPVADKNDAPGGLPNIAKLGVAPKAPPLDGTAFRGFGRKNTQRTLSATEPPVVGDDSISASVTRVCRGDSGGGLFDEHRSLIGTFSAFMDGDTPLEGEICRYGAVGLFAPSSAIADFVSPFLFDLSQTKICWAPDGGDACKGAVMGPLTPEEFLDAHTDGSECGGGYNPVWVMADPSGMVGGSCGFLYPNPGCAACLVCMECPSCYGPPWEKP